MSEQNLETLLGSAPDEPRSDPQPVTTRRREAPAARRRRLLAGAFRLPGTADPAPQPQRLAAMCAWAAVLGLVGVAIAIRALMAIITGAAPHWFEPAVVGTGVVGIALTVGGFMAVHQRHLPWALLGAASATLVLNVVMTLKL